MASAEADPAPAAEPEPTPAAPTAADAAGEPAAAPPAAEQAAACASPSPEAEPSPSSTHPSSNAASSTPDASSGQSPAPIPPSAAHALPAPHAALDSSTAAPPAPLPTPSDPVSHTWHPSDDPRVASSRAFKSLTRQSLSSTLVQCRAIVHRAAADMERWRVHTGALQESELLAYFDSWTAHLAGVRVVNSALFEYCRGVVTMVEVAGEAWVAAAGRLVCVVDGSAMTGYDVSIPFKSSGGAHSSSTGVLATKLASMTAVGVGRLRGVAAAVKAVAGEQARKGEVFKYTHDACPSTLAGMSAWFEVVAGDIKKRGGDASASLREVASLVSDAYDALESHSNGVITLAPRVKGKDMWLLELAYRRAARAALAVKHAYIGIMASLFEKYRGVEYARAQVIAAAATATATALSELTAASAAGEVATSAAALNTHADFFKCVADDAAVIIGHIRAKSAAAAAETAAEERATAHARAAAASLVTAEDVSESADIVTEAVATRAHAFDDYTVAGAGVNAGAHVHSHAVRETAVPSLDVSPNTVQAAGVPAPSHANMHFKLDPAPSVISPLFSPLVIRCGTLLRSTGTVIKTWKPFLCVLTRDGFLHAFTVSDAKALAAGTPAAAALAAGETSDLATHPDVLLAILKFSNERGSMPHHPAHAAPAVAAAAPAPAPNTARSASGDTVAGVRVPPVALAPTSIDSASHVFTTPDSPTHAAAPAPATDVDTAVVAQPAAPAAAARTTTMPQPCFPAPLMQMASLYAANVSDLLMDTPTGAHVDAVALAKRCTAPPPDSYTLTPATKISFATSVHAHAFELREKAGWFGATSLTLRAMSHEDAVDWAVACNTCIEIVTARDAPDKL